MKNFRKLLIAAGVSLLAGSVYAGLANIDVTVKDQSGNPLSGVEMICAKIDPASFTGDPTQIDFKTGNSSGYAQFIEDTGYDYLIFISKNGYEPSFFQQMNNPGIQPVRLQNTGQTITLNITIWQLPVGSNMGQLRFDVIGISPSVVSDSTTIVADIRNRDTDAPVAMGFAQVWLTSATIFVNNVPAASSSTYRAYCGVVQQVNRIGMESVVYKPVTASAVSTWQFNFADAGFISNVQEQPQGGTTGGTTGSAAFVGVVMSTDNIPLSGAMVELQRHNDSVQFGDFRDSQRVGQTFTDNGGSFAFYNVQAGTYAVSANKQGYLGQYNQNPGSHPEMSPWGTGYEYSVGQMVNVQPLKLEKGFGRVKGRVLVWDEQINNTVPVANAYVSVHGMWDNWPIVNPPSFPAQYVYDNYYTTGPGRGGNGWGTANTASDGTFEIFGLGSGNFSMEIWSEMSQGNYRFNEGYNQQYDSNDPDGNGPQPYCRGGDDLRIQIETGDAPSTIVFSSTAYAMTNYSVGMSSPTFVSLIDIRISTLAARIGIISGTINFKDIGGRTSITTDDPISMMAWENTNTWTGRKVYSWEYSTGPIQNTNYTIYVATGSSYYVQFKSKSWAVLNQQDMYCDLSKGLTSITGKNLTLVPAGSMKVTIKDQYGNVVKQTSHSQPPPGNIYTSGRIMVSGPTHWDTDLSEQTENYIYGLVPGVYKLGVQINKYIQIGEGPSTNLPADYPFTTLENVIVSVDKQTNVEIKLKPGTLVIPGGSASALPTLPAGAKGFYGVGGWKHGDTLTAERLAMTLFSAGEDQSGGQMSDVLSVGFMYDSSIAQWGPMRVPDDKYDFYLGYINIFNPSEPSGDYGGPPAPNFRQSFTTLTTKLNEEIKYDSLNPGATHFIAFGSGNSGTGTLGTCTIKGKIIVQGDKAFSRDAVEKMSNGGMDVFFEYIPTVVLYDNQGSFKGFSSAMPTQARIAAWDAFFNNPNQTIEGALNFFKTELGSYPLEYWCEKLPAGDYTLVIGHPNYPPIMKKVTLTGENEGVNTYDFNMDEAKVPGYSISGVVKSTDGVNVMGANIVIKNRNANIEKKTETDSSGAFALYGLAPGVYRIDVSRGGYAIGGKKVAVSKADISVDIQLKRSDGSISGTVFTQRMPAKVLPEAKIIAYDETENGLATTNYLPSYKVITDNNGQYFIPDVISGHVYKIYCVAESKVLEYRELTAAAGNNTGVDFTLKPAKPRLRISSKKMLINDQILYDFYIECPNRLVNLSNPNGVGVPYCRYSPADTANSAFDATKAVEVLVIPGTNNTYEIAFNPGMGSDYYKMRILATDGVNEFFEDVLFGPQIEARAKKDMAGEIAEGGQIDIDSTGYDTTKIGLDPGSVTPADVTQTTVKTGTAEVPVGGFLSTLPNFQLSKTGNAKSDAMDKLVKSIVASDVYEIDLSGAQLNKSVTLTLNYDNETVGEDELNELQIGKYNVYTGKWEIVQGIVMTDPLTSTVSLDVESIGGTNANPAPKAKWNGSRFVLNKAASTSQSGIYAVFLQDPNTVKQYNGTDFVIFNFPNPFDLKLKSVDTQDDYSTDKYSVTGTMIKYALPSRYTGDIKFYIYNIAAEMVRELDLGVKDGGYYYYAEWDGKNDSGEECASGVYLLIAKCDGVKLNEKLLKMAIIK
ncbi:MAG: carboxypeptidase regulatory-like domain-containing protein [Elusimicrobiota bacterium]